MASIILVANKSDKASVERRTTNLNDLQHELIVIADSSVDGFDSSTTLVPTDGRDVTECISDAARLAKSETLLIIDGSLEIANLKVAELISAAANMDQSGFAYVSRGNEDLTALDAETLLNMVVARGAFNIAAVACKKSAIQGLASERSDSFAEFCMKMVIKSVADGSSISHAATAEETEQEQMTNQACSRCLNQIINTFTIEEIFPNHAWKEHSQESAAASYHTLAAFFLRFEDYENADQSVRLSDQFEESPRSLALRALIAFNRGETLGAVANLVSSLQQYEERKKSDEHYVKFSPSDLETINSSLMSGLEALNKRDNDTAIDHFAKAVFNFDGFYALYGLDSMMH